MSRGSSRSTPPESRPGAPRRAGRFELLQVVYTRRAVPEQGLRKGEHGTVVEVFDRPGRPAYLVEFVAGDGRTRRLAELVPGQLAAAPPAA